MMPSTAPKIVAVANQKGGVGKTTTTINLGTALAAVGRRCLVVDFDPQANATTGLGFNHREVEYSSYDVISGVATVGETILPTAIPNLFLVPGSVDLSGAEVELANAERREYRLREALRSAISGFDYVVIDCPPALGLLTINALVAAHTVLVPLQCEYYALEGITQLMRTVERIKRNLNPALELEGVLLTMFDRRNNLSDMVEKDVRGHFGDKVYRTVIPRNVRVSEAPSHGKPVLLYDLKCAGSQAYAHLAGEILHRRPALAE